MANFTMILRELKHYRRFLILVLTPLIFAPIPLAIGTPVSFTLICESLYYHIEAHLQGHHEETKER